MLARCVVADLVRYLIAAGDWARAIYANEDAARHYRRALETLEGCDPATTRLERLAPPRTVFTGALEHRHLVHLLPLCDVAVVPSIFPEAFGMVAAEAAAAGCPPLVARHSGLAEIAQGLKAEYPSQHASLASFETGDADELREKLRTLLALPAAERAELGAAARRAAVDRWSWTSVADRLLKPFN